MSPEDADEDVTAIIKSTSFLAALSQIARSSIPPETIRVLLAAISITQEASQKEENSILKGLTDLAQSSRDFSVIKSLLARDSYQSAGTRKRQYEGSETRRRTSSENEWHLGVQIDSTRTVQNHLDSQIEVTRNGSEDNATNGIHDNSHASTSESSHRVSFSVKQPRRPLRPRPRSKPSRRLRSKSNKNMVPEREINDPTEAHGQLTPALIVGNGVDSRIQIDKRNGSEDPNAAGRPASDQSHIDNQISRVNGVNASDGHNHTSQSKMTFDGNNQRKCRASNDYTQPSTSTVNDDFARPSTSRGIRHDYAQPSTGIRHNHNHAFTTNGVDHDDPTTNDGANHDLTPTNNGHSHATSRRVSFSYDPTFESKARPKSIQAIRRLSQYKHPIPCIFCDAVPCDIESHYRKRHEITDPDQIVFYNGDLLVTRPTSNINTANGTAPWFLKEKEKAQKNIVEYPCVCRLCGTVFDDPEMLRRHYMNNTGHKIHITQVDKLEELFKFKTGAHLEPLPTSNPRKRSKPYKSKSFDRDNNETSVANDNLQDNGIGNQTVHNTNNDVIIILSDDDDDMNTTARDHGAHIKPISRTEIIAKDVMVKIKMEETDD